MIGNTVQYTAAFESSKKRRDIIKLTKDVDFIPRAQNPAETNTNAFFKLKKHSVTGFPTPQKK
jgi:hypothetical protein